MNYKIYYERNGEELKIWIKNEGKKNTFIMGTMIFDGFMNLEVPEHTQVTLKNMSGDLSVKGLIGNTCYIETDYGSINANEIKANINARSRAGEINLTTITGTIDAKAAYGNMELKDITGDIKTSCTSENITVNNINGNTDIEAKYGNITIIKLRGDLKINNTSGDVVLDDITGTPLEINANYGYIKTTNVSAGLKITSRSGDVSLDNIRGNILLETNYSNQHLASISGNITTSSVSGSIDIGRSVDSLHINSGYGNVNMSDFHDKMIIFVRSGDIYGNNIECTESLNMRTNYGNIRMNLKNKIDELSFDLSASSGQIKIDKDGIKKTKEGGNLVLTQGSISVKGVTNSGSQLFD